MSTHPKSRRCLALRIMKRGRVRQCVAKTPPVATVEFSSQILRNGVVDAAQARSTEANVYKTTERLGHPKPADGKKPKGSDWLTTTQLLSILFAFTRSTSYSRVFSEERPRRTHLLPRYVTLHGGPHNQSSDVHSLDEQPRHHARTQGRRQHPGHSFGRKGSWRVRRAVPPAGPCCEGV